MQNLQLKNITFNYLDENIFTKINLNFNEGWTCIVGNNGCGKTTLLKLIAKVLKPISGTIIGNDIVYYCTQKLDNKPKGFEEFIYTYNSKSFKLKELLKIEDDWFYRWESLSFGEQKRIQIAIALFMEPDVLLLDEPTNHLDLETKKIVLDTLKSFKKIGILISHDRHFLNLLCTNTIIIKNKQVYSFKTNYDEAKKHLDEQLSFLQKENENIDKKIKKLQNNVQLQKQKVSQSKQRLSKASVSKKDKSLKEKINLAKLTGKDKNDSRLVTTFSKKSEELFMKKNLLDKKFDKGIKIKVKDIKKSKFSIFLSEDEIKLTEEKTLRFPNLWLNHNDKICIVGDNGVGKSTFLKYLISKIESTQSFVYLPQEIKEKEINKLNLDIDNLDNEKKGELLTCIQRLSSNPKSVLNSSSLSPGELRKLFIAKAILDNINLIILDEPTNHMDIDSIESIQKALNDYKKALIVVSHDKTFIEKIPFKIWKIDLISKKNSLLKEYDGYNQI